MPYSVYPPCCGGGSCGVPRPSLADYVIGTGLADGATVDLREFREGFFEREQFQEVCRRRPEDLQVAVSLAYALGWRMQSEVLSLQRRQVDLEAGTLRLEPGTTKNDEGRVAYLPADLGPPWYRSSAAWTRSSAAPGAHHPVVFPHLTGAKVPNVGRRRTHVLGDRRGDFRKAWLRACRAAGCPGMLRHDFRRTAVRNMVNAGVAERGDASDRPPNAFGV